MKLSEQLKFLRHNNYTPGDKDITACEQLESDSELLSDLLEMLKEEGEHAICLIVTNYEIGQSSYKETVQQAVKKWKEGRK